jgi:hypothetical protein
MMCYLRHETKHKKAKDWIRRDLMWSRRKGAICISLCYCLLHRNGTSLNLEHVCDESNHVLVQKHMFDLSNTGSL